MNTPRDEQPASLEEPPHDADEPETLSKSAWTSLILFAAFVVVTSSCMAGLVFR